MPRGKQALERWNAEDFAGRLLLPPSVPSGEGEEPEARPEGRMPAVPPQTTLVLFDRGTPDDRRLAGVLAAAAADHPDHLRAVAVPAGEVLPRLEAWQQGRRAFDTFDFRRWPSVGVFRLGRLVTTFHPRRVFFIERLQEREEREQIEIFLSKMVYYDPAKVKEQKNIELEAEA